MSEPIKDKDLTGTVKELQREHPTLQERLLVYRDRRQSYEAKRMTRPAVASPSPARQGARRELRA